MFFSTVILGSNHTYLYLAAASAIANAHLEAAELASADLQSSRKATRCSRYLSPQRPPGTITVIVSFVGEANVLNTPLRTTYCTLMTDGCIRIDAPLRFLFFLHSHRHAGGPLTIVPAAILRAPRRALPVLIHEQLVLLSNARRDN